MVCWPHIRITRLRAPVDPIALGLLALVIAPAWGRAEEAEALSARFRTAARKVLPTVVSLRTEGRTPPPGLVVPIAPFDPDGFFPRDPGGSGVVIDASKGHILTNDHVVRRASRVLVTLHDGRAIVAREVHRDPRSDLALLVIDPAGLKDQAEWGDSDALDLGDWVLAIGQPFGLAGTVTAGIVSGTGRGAGAGAAADYEDLIQTDAAINPGNSGGPLINLRGQVVGIATAIRSLSGGYDGVGFAVPAQRARRIAGDLATLGRVRRGSIGVLIRRVSPRPEAPPSESFAPPGAVAITGIAPLSPAASAGLRVGDVLVAVGGMPVRSVGMLQAAIEAAPIGQPLVLRVLRGGQTHEVPVVPAVPGATAEGPIGPGIEEPAPPDPVPVPPAGLRPETFHETGLPLAESSADGLLVHAVAPGTPADLAGLEPGMAPTELDGRPVRTLEQFRAALTDRTAEGRNRIIRIRRGDKVEFRVLLDFNAPSAGPPPVDAPRERSLRRRMEPNRATNQESRGHPHRTPEMDLYR